MVVKKLSAEESAQYREKLITLRNRLRGDVVTMTDTALNKNRMEDGPISSAMPIHMADVGTDNFSQEFSLSLMASESNMLELVDDSLERIDKGTYGICEDCGCVIPKARLNAIPYTSLCVKCAELASR